MQEIKQIIEWMRTDNSGRVARGQQGHDLGAVFPIECVDTSIPPFERRLGDGAGRYDVPQLSTNLSRGQQRKLSTVCLSLVRGHRLESSAIRRYLGGSVALPRCTQHHRSLDSLGLPRKMLSMNRQGHRILTGAVSSMHIV
ncbi:hypothetical protein LIA77_09814 [Sarocladium implicatum]|nr:hypothetical protein LIA77_09814 [Sarocladium implicatum]